MKAAPAITYPADLPITERREDLLATIRDNQVVIVAGETGSGKSTQLPKLCLELGRGIAGMIGHTQPRRIAARAVAERVAEELGSEVGAAVGFAVRFTDRTAEDTLVKVMTDGILLAEIQRDRLLSAYDTIIIDEAHERSLNIDFLLGFLTRLLPQRPDLKLIITSATIDTARFAEHFGAPVVEVSGRTYPVELRYRPIGEEAADDRDQVTAIGDAVVELTKEGPGDILVFLSGEREIRDTAEAVQRLGLPHTEVLPLYARLSAAEQHRVFAPHQGRRVVLATNVAETSLTVPGIRYVVDPGTARISRYNRRTKVQRLPIEPVSQASANQRAGRCGRVAPGICIRLYSEEDFDGRPEFTEPEILRTNLASVILQMANIGLGDVAGFPFVEPPDGRSIADGLLLLEELGALAGDHRDDGAVRLTRIGRRLARLPVDPRLGRMVLEADRLGCVREVLVVAAALSIIDPRERPSGTDQQRAAELHKRFDDPDSDFVAYLNLWAYLRELRHELSSNQFRKRVRAEHLNWLRVREWEDVHSQLRQIAGGLGVHAGRGDEPAAADTVHQALLAGLLSHIGTWDEVQQDYRGARQARFALGRGSSLAKAKTRPRWVMAGELVETNRLWGHTVARIRPEWIEQAAGEVAKRSHGDAWWDQDRAAAMVEERVSVFGLEVARRRVNLARVDEALARELFIFHALVLGEWDAEHEFLGRNAATIAAIEALEAKVRRRDLLVDPDTIYDLYDARLPATVTGGKAFDRWWRDHRLTDADRLVFSVDELLDPSGGTVSATDYPDVWPAGDLTLPLTYRFEPDEPLDGVTVDIPVDVLNRFDGGGLDWQVPGYRFELVTALVRSLPKPLRRAFVPVPDHVAAFLERAGPADGPLLEVLGRELTRMTGDRIPPDSWQLDAVPAHLRVTFRAVAADGRALAWSKDLDALRERLQPKVRAAVARSAPAVQHTGLTSWSIDPLPAVVESGVDGRTVTAYPALVDEGDTAGVRAFATADEAAVAHRAGLRRLLLLGAGNVAKRIRTSLPRDAELALASLPGQSVAQVVADVASAAVDSLITSPGKVRDRDSFEALLLQVREGSTGVGLAAAGVVGRIADRVADIHGRVDRLTGGAMAAADDIRVQARGLVHPGFVAEAGIDRLRDIDRYLAGVQSRLDKLAADPAKDRRHMAVVQALEDEWVAVADRDVGAKVRWMLEELRVSLFAQSLGTKGSISEQRVRKAIAALSSRR